MDVGELRVGNLVLNDGMLYRLNPIDIYNHSVNLSSGFEPIELTEDILVKCGFELKDPVNGGFLIKINYEHQKEYLYCSRKGIIALYSEKKNSDFIIMNKCNYLHHLQNLYFALTGEELNVKLVTLSNGANNNG